MIQMGKDKSENFQDVIHFSSRHTFTKGTHEDKMNNTALLVRWIWLFDFFPVWVPQIRNITYAAGKTPGTAAEVYGEWAYMDQ